MALLKILFSFLLAVARADGQNTASSHLRPMYSDQFKFLQMTTQIDSTLMAVSVKIQEKMEKIQQQYTNILQKLNGEKFISDL